MPDSGDLLVCGWYKKKGAPAHETGPTNNVACLGSSDHGEKSTIIITLRCVFT
jgi:hypothetical protein